MFPEGGSGMAKLSELIRQVDDTAKAGERAKALKMLESLIKKVPDNEALKSRKKKYTKELELEERLIDLENRFGVS
jgi:hypothetical protein